MTEQLANSVYNPTAQLSAGIDDNDLSLTVSDVSEFIDTAAAPLTGAFRVMVWDGATDASKEIIKVGAFDSGTGVCSSLTRAVEGKNAAQAHAAGDLVELVISAGGLEQYVSDHSGGGAAALIDLGVVSIADLVTGGPQVLYTPSVGELVEVFVGNVGYVEFLPNSMIFDLHVAQNTGLTADVAPCGVLGGVAPTNLATVTLPSGTPAPLRVPPYVSSSTDPFVAYAISADNAFNMTAALAAWQSNHAYASEVMILGPDNHVWSALAGTSAGSIPDFASNEGGTVVDNTVTWTDEGPVPSQGSVHLYARVSSP